MKNDGLTQALQLSSLLEKDRSIKSRLANAYSNYTYRLTRIYEGIVSQRIRKDEADILNFGCGYQYYEAAVNCDLLTPHRYLMNKRRPDIYWSGTTELNCIINRFNGVVCEHVIEHILPVHVLGLFRNFHRALKEEGVAVITFPDIRKVLACTQCQGFSSPTVAANSVIYRFGHAFMYDTDIVCEMLIQAGFKDVRPSFLESSPLRDFLAEDREPETAYVLARKG